MVEAVRILDEIKAGKVQPVYFLCGEEAYYIDLISNYLEEHLLDESEKAFNQTIVYGKEADVSHIIEAARRFPMMAERQLVMIKEAQSMRGIEKAGELHRATYQQHRFGDLLQIQKARSQKVFWQEGFEQKRVPGDEEVVRKPIARLDSILRSFAQIEDQSEGGNTPLRIHRQRLGAHGG